MRRAAHRGGTRVRLRRAILWAGVGVIALSACGSAHHSATPGTRSATQTATTRTARTTAPSQPSALTKLRKAMDSALRAAGRQSSALVYDLAAARDLYALRADVMRPPASVEKLYTTIALLLTLSSDTTF